MLRNAFLLALREIRRNVLRSFLTILGIVIGVAAVIIMVTVGGGATAQVGEQIASMGSNILMVTPGKRMGPGQIDSSAPLKVADGEAILSQISAVRTVAPISSKSMKAIFGNQNWSTQVTGSNNEYFLVSNRTIDSGREFLESELRSGAGVCVVGQTVAKMLFGAQLPVGENIRLEKLSCKVVGTLAPKGQNSMGMDQDDIVIVPIRTFQRRVSGSQDISRLQVSVRDGVQTTRVQKDIQLLMRERRHLSVDEEDNFSVMDMKEISQMLTSTTKLLTALLSAVAGVSLLVGGIGIMNIMLVSVTERTREIGIRMAIGAFESEVLTQFLVEAITLSCFGGLLGITLGLVGSYGLSALLEVPFIYNGSIVTLAFMFSAAIGVMFGYFPALKASRLDPIEALRHE